MNDLQKIADQYMFEQNNRVIPEFEGYSPIEMHHLLHNTFGTYSPIKLLDPGEGFYDKIPVLNHVKFLASLIADAGELRLTSKSNLPPDVVVKLYNQGFIRDKYIDSGRVKLRRESDLPVIGLARFLLLLSGLIKKRNNRLSLTKAARNIFNDDFLLLKSILDSYCKKFSWAYLDLYEGRNIGQLGHGFSLLLFSKYGHEKRDSKFYAEKYFRAFPQLVSDNQTVYFKDNHLSCYSLRTFDRFLEFFGLVVIDEPTEMFSRERVVQKSDLFDKMIQIKPHTVIHE